ncbi:BTB/POZ domain-containing protein At1g67900-like [Salvia miltiorrhiza]|uniref:BTB/POZ domain-containing protein At1g67900-like n=1 Tax=Salvia miltiorrhiza TaxID=226208 RepID=UPI0025AC6845|nr:BTB/POZ domain-containing protein At1g67900-like [Salvia miltiorrhiza]
MKFMKLGSRPDTFYTTEAVRSVSSDVSSDLIVQVKGSRYLLHKFPLLSKCLRLQRLYAESPEAEVSELQLIKLHDFPGGVEAFELCAKFCYGITITLSAFNIVSIRCAAEYLQMTEDVEKGNLIYKVEVFLNSCILHGWRDSLVTLQTTKAFPLVSEEVGVTGRCIEAVASRVLAHPEKVGLAYSRGGRDELSSNGSESHHRHRAKGWWGEDLAELGIDLYWRVMAAIKTGGKVPPRLVGDALRAYASRWLPNLGEADGGGGDGEVDARNRLVLESIVSLLPSEKGAVSCSFLLKLLKAANVLKASASSKAELATRAGLQLDEATVGDLLLPRCSCSEDGTKHDVDAVLNMLEEFVSRGQSPPTSPPRGERRGAERRRSRSAQDVDVEFQERRRSSSASHSSKLKVAKLVDGYLQEIARDAGLPMSKFIAIAEAIPGFARLNHDGLYKAIDVYLKVHPELSKSERKRLCRILDCKKLSVEACMHAAQNEMLPLRVVVQVLFFEQARASMADGQVAELPSNIKVLKSSVSTLKMKLAEDHDVEKPSKIKSLSMMPSRPKRMFSKLWPISRSASEKN